MLAKSTPGMLLTAAAVRPWSAALWTCCSGDDASSRATACSIQDVKAAARPRLPGISLTETRLWWFADAALSQQRTGQAYAPRPETPSSAGIRPGQGKKPGTHRV